MQARQTAEGLGSWYRVEETRLDFMIWYHLDRYVDKIISLWHRKIVRVTSLSYVTVET